MAETPLAKCVSEGHQRSSSSESVKENRQGGEILGPQNASPPSDHTTNISLASKVSVVK